MGTTLNKDAYKKLIKEDMEKVEKYFPEHSLEKKHIQEVLKCSIECYYPSDGKKKIDTESNCSIPVVIESVCYKPDHVICCLKQNGLCTEDVPDCEYRQTVL